VPFQYKLNESHRPSITVLQILTRQLQKIKEKSENIDIKDR